MSGWGWGRLACGARGCSVLAFLTVASSSFSLLGTRQASGAGDNFVASFKLLLIGDSNVGKSCLASRFVSDRFSFALKPTIGASAGGQAAGASSVQLLALVTRYAHPTHVGTL